jgi:hypothetical protein
MKSPKIKCEGCGKEYNRRFLVAFKGKLLCRSCRSKLETSRAQESASRIGIGRITIEEVLNRVYEPQVYFTENSKARTVLLNLPICCIGKKFKLVLVDDNTTYEEAVSIMK